jgi:DNA repair protein RecN (Recombination protein N)
LQAVEDRLAALERVKRRYGPSLDDVLAGAARFARNSRRWARAKSAPPARSAERDARACFVSPPRRGARARVKARELGAALERDLTELAMPRAAWTCA